MVALAAVVALSCATTGVHVGIAEFRSTAELSPLSAALSGLVANELQRMGAFKVTSSSQVRDQLSLERQKQLLGCADETCSSAATLDMGFDFLVTGTLSRYAGANDKPLSLELVLLDQKTGSRAGSQVSTGRDEAELMANVSPAIAKLVATLLKERSGSLVVLSSEAGAVLKVDDVTVGTTPLEGRLQVAGGPHYLRLEKDGFVAWQREVRIAADQLTEESVRLVPSPDFVAAYESKQNKLRVGAWATTAVSVVTIGAAIAFESRAASLYGSSDNPGSFLALREQVDSGEESQRDRLLQLRAQISNNQALAAVFVGVAAVTGAGAIVLWLLGDDPGRYSAYRELDVKAGIGAGPGGGFAVLSGAW